MSVDELGAQRADGIAWGGGCGGRKPGIRRFSACTGSRRPRTCGATCCRALAEAATGRGVAPDLLSFGEATLRTRRRPGSARSSTLSASGWRPGSAARRARRPRLGRAGRPALGLRPPRLGRGDGALQHRLLRRWQVERDGGRHSRRGPRASSSSPTSPARRSARCLADMAEGLDDGAAIDEYWKTFATEGGRPEPARPLPLGDARKLEPYQGPARRARRADADPLGSRRTPSRRSAAPTASTSELPGSELVLVDVRALRLRGRAQALRREVVEFLAESGV